MNKYQNALRKIASLIYEASKGTLNAEDCEEYLALKELVEKEVPKEPTYEGDGYDENGNMNFDTWICPNCGEKYEVDYQEYDRCPKCGQLIDWSEKK